ncbi:MAG: nucleotidyltransferase domain-containing protein [Janthinobacterium lividum]
MSASARKAAGRKAASLIEQVMLAPASVAHLTELEWDLLLRQGRRTNLLSRLTALLDQHGLLEGTPGKVHPHLISARRITERQSKAVHHEVACICQALSANGERVILLKGAAYLRAGLPASHGRIFSDIDIRVPKAAMAHVEADLMMHGWRSNDVSKYDERYYRRWMHEIPPMQHLRRGTTIDVHHAILPISARIKVNTQALFAAAIAVPGQPNVHVLQPADMVLHSATHLFHEGELENGLRDLFDLDALLRHFGQQPGFWEMLAPRAQELGLQRPLYYALKYVVDLLHTPVPDAVMTASLAGQPSLLADKLMAFCYRRALRQLHASVDDASSSLARAIIYVRSHWIRMPAHLLVYHLGRKFFVRPPAPSAEPVAGQETVKAVKAVKSANAAQPVKAPAS